MKDGRRQLVSAIPTVFEVCARGILYVPILMNQISSSRGLYSSPNLPATHVCSLFCLWMYLVSW